jgi:hypothetical protein
MSRMAKDDAREAEEIDQELDQREVEQAAEAEPGAPARLWWEDDPQLAERFRRR